MKYYSIGEFENKIGKTVQMLRNWDKNETLKSNHTTEGEKYDKDFKNNANSK